MAFCYKILPVVYSFTANSWVQGSKFFKPYDFAVCQSILYDILKSDNHSLDVCFTQGTEFFDSFYQIICAHFAICNYSGIPFTFASSRYSGFGSFHKFVLNRHSIKNLKVTVLVEGLNIKHLKIRLLS